MIQKTFLRHCALPLLLLVATAGALFAAEVTRIEIIGNTVDINLQSITSQTPASLSEREIRAIGTAVTAAYHSRGYTTTRVDRLVLRRDGTLQVHILESHVKNITVTGVSTGKTAKIRAFLAPVINQVYNRSLVLERAEALKREFNLNRVVMTPLNYRNSADVHLAVEVRESTAGNVYGGIGIEPIYGVVPSLGYYYPFTSTALDMHGEAGYREGRFRKLKGEIKLFIFSDDNDCALYFGGSGSRNIETWEYQDADYTVLAYAPAIGIRAVFHSIIFDIKMHEIISHINSYYTEEYEDFDTRLTASVTYTDSSSIMNRFNTAKISASVSGGRSTLEKSGYSIAEADIRIPFSPAVWFRIIPRAHIRYTTSHKRLFWSYVYDANFLGFFDDYTASRFKNIAGLDFEFELFPELLYVGPFINSGYFENELQEWTWETGTGCKVRITYRGLQIQSYYAWDISNNPADGGLYIFAETRF
jgi:hypothetical protein